MNDLHRPRGVHATVQRLWLGYWIVLFGLTHMPMPGWPSWAPETSDKTLHLVAYFVLTSLGWLALSRRIGHHSWRPIEWLGVVLVYGACDEVTQAMVGRNCSPTDWLADAAGALAGLVSVEGLRRLHRVV